jgi:predicted MFS family arabinose efflux permease
VLAGALLLQAAGSALMSTHDGRLPLVAASITLVGAGNVLATIAFTLLGLAGARTSEHATAAGLIGTAQQIGATAGLTVTGAVVATGTADGAFLAAAGFSLLAVVVVWATPPADRGRSRLRA